MKRLPVPAALVEFLKHTGLFILVSHMDPDGDCIGSSLALSHFLTRRGNTVVQLNPGPFDRTEIADLESQFHSKMPERAAGDGSAVRCVVLDASTSDRIGALSDEVKGVPMAVVDHHSSGLPFGDVRYIDPSSPSTSYLIHRVIEAMGETPDAYEARWLLFALATDTGYFRFLDESAGDVLESVGRLVDAGASPAAIYQQMYGGRSIESRRFLGELLRRTESHCDGRLLVCWQTMADDETYGKESKDSASLYQLLMTVKGCEAIVFVREVGGGACTASLRSLNSLDVGKIAASYGGGGHARAAGFLTERPLNELKSELIGLFCTKLGSES